VLESARVCGPMDQISGRIDQRRTFAIISHPDAGKTTLTEKMLLFGGAIQLAGAVRARGDQRRTRSDWMKVERDRGISVTTSVMTFEWDDKTFNLLDTPGHQDFSEDTYRVLTAVDSVVMVLDAAKGIEAQTRKLFEVCRLRDLPIVTFINKLDRDCRDSFDLLDEIEQSLALDVSPVSWPIGTGRDFRGCYDLLRDHLLLFERKGLDDAGIRCEGLTDQKLNDLLGAEVTRSLREEVDMARGLCKPFDVGAYLEGHLTPVFFGSALNNFGVRELLRGVSDFAPPPRKVKTRTRLVDPHEPQVTAFVFKIQANMDPKHRDRMAFLRLCSGHFRRGMKLVHVRTQTPLNINNPTCFLAQDREMAEEAVAGDILGITSHGRLRIGDSLTEGEDLTFTGIPSFAPELLQRVRPRDPLRAKHLNRALEQLAEEGVARVFRPEAPGGLIVGVVGVLQFDVLADRIRTEYDIAVDFEATSHITARWVECSDRARLAAFAREQSGSMATDHAGDLVFLVRNAWHLESAQREWPEISFFSVREQNWSPS